MKHWGIDPAGLSLNCLGKPLPFIWQSHSFFGGKGIHVIWRHAVCAPERSSVFQSRSLNLVPKTKIKINPFQDPQFFVLGMNQHCKGFLKWGIRPCLIVYDDILSLFFIYIYLGWDKVPMLFYNWIFVFISITWKIHHYYQTTTPYLSAFCPVWGTSKMNYKENYLQQR